MTDIEIINWLRFSRMEFTAKAEKKLLANFNNNINDFLSISDKDLLEMNLLTPNQINKFNDWKTRDVSVDLKLMETNNVNLITITSDSYPSKLSTIFDPPSVLYVRGNVNLNEYGTSIGIVGSRSANNYGISVAEQISSELSRYGVRIISGGARGIDTAAHRGAIKNFGITFAVLGCGVNVTYPTENKKLFDSIVDNGGAIISEYPFGSQPEPWRFPARNRIISGMSDGLLVCQAPLASGSLITAHYALEQGRDVFAVPGNINDKRNSGSNKLIKDGAALVENAVDIISELGLSIYENISSKESNETKLELDDCEQSIYTFLSYDPMNVDEISDKSKLSISEIMANLTLMELKGFVKRLPGNNFIRNG